MKALSPRERILQAASLSFSEYGFRGVTIAQIAVKAKVNEVTVYRIFGGKQKLFDAAFEWLREKVNKDELLSASLRHPTQPYHAFAGTVLWLICANQQFNRIALWAMLENPREGRKFISSIVVPVRQQLAEFIRHDPKLREGVDALAASNLLVGAIVNYCHFREFMGGKLLQCFHPQDPTNKFVDVWLNGIHRA